MSFYNISTLHFCLDFVIIHALYDLYYPVSMDYTDLLLSNRYHLFSES